MLRLGPLRVVLGSKAVAPVLDGVEVEVAVEVERCSWSCRHSRVRMVARDGVKSRKARWDEAVD